MGTSKREHMTQAAQPALEEAEEAIDARTSEMIDEFWNHHKDYLENGGEGIRIDHGMVFEGWAIQKMAALQLIAEKQSARIEALENKIGGQQ